MNSSIFVKDSVDVKVMRILDSAPSGMAVSKRLIDYGDASGGRIDQIQTTTPPGVGAKNIRR